MISESRCLRGLLRRGLESLAGHAGQLGTGHLQDLPNDLEPALVGYVSGADVTVYPPHPVTPTLVPTFGNHLGAEARRRHLCLVESLGIFLPCQMIPADLRLVCAAAYPLLTAIDPSLQHADSMTVGVPLTGQVGSKWVSRRVGGFILKQVRRGDRGGAPHG